MMRPEQRLWWAQVLVWFIPALWAVNYFCARLAPGVVDPHILALGRWAIAGLVLGALARHEIWQARRQIWSDRWQYLALGALGMLVCGAWVYWGAQTTSAMNIALIYAAAPVLIAWGSAIWLDEGMRPRQMWGVALALVGADNVVLQTEPLTASEDFAYMLDQVPGSYLFIGNGDANHGGHGACMVHNPNYDFEDRNIPVGAAFWVALTERFLA